jgi:hypothetical protein
MTNKEILDIVYETLKASQEAGMGVDTDQIVKEQIHFIQQEWQRADEGERTKWEDHPLTKWDEGQTYNMNEQDVNENSAGGGAHGYFSQQWYNKKDERHRGLEIGEDGTVKGFTDE